MRLFSALLALALAIAAALQSELSHFVLEPLARHDPNTFTSRLWNTVINWQLYPPVSAVIRSGSLQYYSLVLLIISAILLAAVLIERVPAGPLFSRRLEALSASLVTHAIMISLLGLDPIVLSFTVAGSAGALTVSRFSFSLPYLIAAALISTQIGLLSLAAWPFAVILLLALSHPPIKTEDLGNLHDARFNLFLTAFIFLIATIGILAAPPNGEFSYPPFARVVNDDGVPGLIRPLIGADPNIQIYNYQVARDAMFWPAVIGVISAVFLYLRRAKSPLTTLWPSAAVIIWTAIFADIFLPAQFAQILPLDTLIRSVPNLAFLPVLPCAVAVGLIILIRDLLSYRYFTSYISPAIAVLALLFVRSDSGVNSALHNLKQIESELLSDYNTRVAAAKALNSPSYRIITQERAAFEQRIAIDEKGRQRVDGSFLDFKQSDQSQFAALHDDHQETRWSTNSGQQTGSEWLYVLFNQPRAAVVGLNLSLGAFKSDFPRGLKISTFRSCPAITAQQKINSADGVELFRSEPWRGAIEFTEAGLPYYAPQSRVIVRFNSALDLQCLLIEQIGTDQNYDWSIAELYTLH